MPGVGIIIDDRWNRAAGIGSATEVDARWRSNRTNRSWTSSWATTSFPIEWSVRAREAALLGLRRPPLPASAEPDVLRHRRLVADLRPHVPPLRHAVRRRLDHQERQRLPLHRGRARRSGLDRRRDGVRRPLRRARAARSRPTAEQDRQVPRRVAARLRRSTSSTGGASGSCRRWSATSRSSRRCSTARTR